MSTGNVVGTDLTSRAAAKRPIKVWLELLVMLPVCVLLSIVMLFAVYDEVADMRAVKANWVRTPAVVQNSWYVTETRYRRGRPRHSQVWHGNVSYRVGRQVQTVDCRFGEDPPEGDRINIYYDPESPLSIHPERRVLEESSLVRWELGMVLLVCLFFLGGAWSIYHDWKKAGRPLTDDTSRGNFQS